MKICIVIPVQRQSRRGNEITALRWQSILEDLAHHVQIRTCDEGIVEADCLIALHAVKSHSAIQRFKQIEGNRPVVVCLSGTDLHGVFNEVDDDPDVKKARTLAEESLATADRIILLEPNGQKKLPKSFHAKCQVIFQSAERISINKPETTDRFQVSIIGHLRRQKDPMLTAKAARFLPPHSKISLVHVGEILEERYRVEVQRECEENPRYQWLGKLEHDEAQKVLVNSSVTVLSSIHEGAPSIISEAVVNEIPILATRIDATLGMLGADYPGLFQVGDAKHLANLLLKTEQDDLFRNLLVSEIRKNQKKFTRDAEARELVSLLKSLA